MYIHNHPFPTTVPYLLQMTSNVRFAYPTIKKTNYTVKTAESPKALSPGHRLGIIAINKTRP